MSNTPTGNQDYAAAVAKRTVTAQIDKWEAAHRRFIFGEIPRTNLTEAVAAVILEAMEAQRAADLDVAIKYLDSDDNRLNRSMGVLSAIEAATVKPKGEVQ